MYIIVITVPIRRGVSEHNDIDHDKILKTSKHFLHYHTLEHLHFDPLKQEEGVFHKLH